MERNVPNFHSGVAYFATSDVYNATTPLVLSFFFSTLSVPLSLWEADPMIRTSSTGVLRNQLDEIANELAFNMI